MNHYLRPLTSISLFILMLITACRTDVGRPESVLGPSPVKHAEYEQAAVATAHPLASDIGRDILKAGGNAIDAAIAVQFALAVCYPVAGNIGGGGFMIYRTNEGAFHSLDFRETAPARAYKNMFLDENGAPVREKSLEGALACGVPGTVDGMWQAFRKFSALKDWKALVLPAVRLADNGFRLSEMQAQRLNKYRPHLERNNQDEIPFVGLEEWEEGDLLQQPELARTLEYIALHGRDGFYKSWVADSIVSGLKSAGGIMTQSDLDAYESRWREVISTNYRNYRIVSMPPPSSGGIALVQLFNALSHINIDSLGFHSTPFIHLMTEAERRVYADRAVHLGDPDFYAVPLAQLLEASYMKDRMADFSFKKSGISADISAGHLTESEQTTHFSIVDSKGNAVSLTTTINTAFGSKRVIPGAGFLMNNEMDDFSVKPGVPNYFGLVGNEANAIEPGKRMLSSMTPTIVEKNGALHIVVGTPGGSTIITSVFQVLVNIIIHGMNAYDAIAACRFHHQWLPDKIQVESDCFDSIQLEALKALGHNVMTRAPIGKVETIVIKENGTIEAAADPRGDDSVSGY